MLKNLLSVESKSITGAALLISITTLLSRVIGLLRDRTFAHYFAASPAMDAYFAAFKIPDLIYNLLIAGALTAGFIPTFTKLFFESHDKSEAWKLVNNIINIVAVFLSVLAILGIIFTPYITGLIAPGFSEERLELLIKFTRIMFFSPLLLGISMVFGGVLQSLRQFILYSFAPVFYNIGIILGATSLTKYIGVNGLAYGVILGALLHLIIQTIGVYQNNYRWQWIFNLKEHSTILIAKLMMPRTFGLAISQINILIITALASTLPLGSVSVFNFANNLQAVPTGIIGIPFALAVFPILSRKAGDLPEFSRQLSLTVRQIIFLIAPLSVLVLLLRAQIVRVVLGTGAFDWNATISTANTLAFFSFGLIAQSLIPLFARAFYALSNTKTPFLIGIISEIISILSALLLMKPYGVSGLALASSIGAVINIILLSLWLQDKVKNIFEDSFVKMILKVSFASFLMGIIVQSTKLPLSKLFDLNYFWGILSQGLIAGILGLLVYGITCRLLKVEEMMHLQASFKKKWLRPWRIEEGMDEAEKLS